MKVEFKTIHDLNIFKEPKLSVSSMEQYIEKKLEASLIDKGKIHLFTDMCKVYPFIVCKLAVWILRT